MAYLSTLGAQAAHVVQACGPVLQLLQLGHVAQRFMPDRCRGSGPVVVNLPQEADALI